MPAHLSIKIVGQVTRTLLRHGIEILPVLDMSAQGVTMKESTSPHPQARLALIASGMIEKGEVFGYFIHIRVSF